MLKLARLLNIDGLQYKLWQLLPQNQTGMNSAGSSHY